MTKRWSLLNINEYCLELVSNVHTPGVYNSAIRSFIGQDAQSVVLVRGVQRRQNQFRSVLLDAKLYAPGHSFTDPSNNFIVTINSFNPSTRDGVFRVWQISANWELQFPGGQTPINHDL